MAVLVIPKDVKALIKTSDENNYSLDILKAVENVMIVKRLSIIAKSSQNILNH